jgi:hypothetical protein
MSIAGECERAASKLPAKKMAFAETNIHFTPKRSDSFAHIGDDVVLASVKEDPIQAYSDAFAVSALVTVGSAVAIMVTSNAVMNCVRHNEAIVVLLFQTDIAISPTGWASVSSLSLVLLLVAIVDPCSFSCVRSGWTRCWSFACSVIANVLAFLHAVLLGWKRGRRKGPAHKQRDSLVHRWIDLASLHYAHTVRIVFYHACKQRVSVDTVCRRLGSCGRFTYHSH